MTQPPAEAVTAYNELSNCTASAAEACDYTTIVYTHKVTTANDCTNCTAGGTAAKYCNHSSAAGTCGTDATCTSLCRSTDNTCTLTQAMVTHISDICIPQIDAWLRRYRVSSKL